MRARASTVRLLPAIGCLLLAGCNSGAQLHRDLYTRELRLQEDEIYRLEECLRDYQQIVRSLRQENAQLKQGEDGEAVPAPKPEKLGPDAEGERSLLDDLDWSPDRPAESPADIPPNDGDAPDIELPNIDGGQQAENLPVEEFSPEELPAAAPFDAGAPEIELPTTPDAPPPGPTAPPFEEAPPANNPLRDEADPEPFKLIPLSDRADDGPVVPTGAVAEQDPPPSIASIAVDAAAGPPEPTGEATLDVVLTPRRRDGETARFDGEASLMLRDPTKPRRQAMLARWDYTPQEVTTAWRTGEQDAQEATLHFALVLPKGLPTARPLELWVRLVDQAGRKRLARITTALGDQLQREEPPRGQTPQEKPTAAPWNATSASDRQPAATAETADSGWRHAPQTPRGSEVRMASFEEPAPEPAKTKTKPVDDGWSSR